VSAVAVTEGERVLAEDDAPSAALHGETLVPRIRAVMTRARLSLADVGLVGVGVGPGSFTGLRVGLATAKGLALALGVPVRGVDSLAVLAYGALSEPGVPPDAVALSVIDAHRGEVFVAAYARGHDETPGLVLGPTCVAVDAAVEALRAALESGARSGDLVVCGDGATVCRDDLARGFGQRARFLEGTAAQVRGRFVAIAARTAHAREGASDPVALEPFYLRQADVTLPR
jgi:tRNA threonylcarbamoyladenosine biosynthesis protein TsaB